MIPKSKQELFRISIFVVGFPFIILYLWDCGGALFTLLLHPNLLMSYGVERYVE